ncbi:NADH:flavin oxidoreductase/NADH oxidase [Pseudomonas syringae pv. aceris]|uniref:NADH:flavin oxidoreductase/NADH oxidase n=1 Tax=Pseudomonas syringae pv. aceris TaxID=199198 RepID=A0A0L8IQ35_PSESX|nr:NADH:flavin oxidoreductase [Pseudomonas syringae]KOG03533.1 NADHflavin oxidoreductase/NADH oxidase [Pseudomonas syringae pv. aceris]KPW19556.1 NADH:flavin oxidoreductase/NADH oxidase [Pseudomonas syringae pv. aceris]
MNTDNLFTPLSLLRGPSLKNRLMLAPLTNRQSYPDGKASDDDIKWLEMLGAGGYSLVHTCATTIMAGGIAFQGQLGIHSDDHLPGLARMAQAAGAGGALTSVQLHHGGFRVDRSLGGIPLPVSDGLVEERGEVNEREIVDVRDRFVEAAVRAERAGFDGVALHGAFAFVLAQFLSSALNYRSDQYGGSLENRSRFVFETINAVRAAVGEHFQLGIRLSVDRHGIKVEEIRDVVAEIMRQQQVDYIDLALWDAGQRADDGPSKGRKMLDLFTELPRHGVRLGTAGKIMGAQRAAELLEEGCDFVLIGRAACIHPDVPNRIAANPEYISPQLPVNEHLLRSQGMSPQLIAYLRTWPDFVSS